MDKNQILNTYIKQAIKKRGVEKTPGVITLPWRDFTSILELSCDEFKNGNEYHFNNATVTGGINIK